MKGSYTKIWSECEVIHFEATITRDDGSTFSDAWDHPVSTYKSDPENDAEQATTMLRNRIRHHELEAQAAAETAEIVATYLVPLIGQEMTAPEPDPDPLRNQWVGGEITIVSGALPDAPSDEAE